MLTLGLLTVLSGCGNLVAAPPATGDTDDTDLTDTDGGGGGGGNGGGGNGGGNGGGGNGGVDTDDGPDTDATSGDATTLMITEIFDGSEHAALQYVEIFNPTRGAFQLDGWALNVGKGTDTKTYRFPSVTLPSGEAFVVCSQAGANAFENVFSDTCDDESVDEIGLMADGDHPLALLDAGHRPVDIYGPYLKAATGWEYEDTVVKRKAGRFATATFALADWTKSAGEDDAHPHDRN